MRIAVFANDDMTSNLIFAPLFEVPGVEVVRVSFASGPKRHSRSMLGGAFSLARQMSLRYWAFLVMSNGLFKVFEGLTLGLRLSPRWGPLASVRRLAALKGLECNRVQDFSSSEIVADLKAKKVDLLLIRIGDRLKDEVIHIARLGTWCIHSSLLPAFGGIAGEFHALRTAGAPVGSTVFEVTPVLDGGPPLSQVAFPRSKDRSVYYHMVNNNIAAGELLVSMVRALANDAPLPRWLLNEGLDRSYFSWPSGDHVAQLRRAGMRIIRLSEIVRLALVSIRASRKLWHGKSAFQ